jgi:hypothetical protein
LGEKIRNEVKEIMVVLCCATYQVFSEIIVLMSEKYYSKSMVSI